MENFPVEHINIPIRLDKYISHIKTELTNGIVQSSLRKGKIKLNSRKAGASEKVKNGDIISFYGFNNVNEGVKVNSNSILKPSRRLITLLSNSIIYEDENFIAINKPAGLSTQGGSCVVNSIDTLMKEVTQNSEIRLVHRLDKETTGALVMAKNFQAAANFSDLLRSRKIHKLYVALIIGSLAQKEMEVDYPLKGVFIGGQEIVMAHEMGKSASTLFRSKLSASVILA